MKSQLIRSLVVAASWLPLPLARQVGRLLGWALYRIPNRETRQGRVNLHLCFPQMDADQREALLRETLKQNASTLLEMPGIWRRDHAATLRHIGCDDDGPLRDLLACGKGVIVVAPHLGNWEMLLHHVAELGPITALYRPPRVAAIDALMHSGRLRTGAHAVVPTNAKGVKALYQALRKGQMIGILPDQQPKESGGGAAEFAPFFGVPALTMTLVARLAAKSGAAVIFAFAERLPGGRFEVRWVPAPAGVASADLAESTAALNAGVEACVRLAPSQYQWTYRRFSAQPEGRSNPYHAC